ncbi:MAG TPA: hypothetical protein VFK48_14255 [Usitatibacter sp.]|nr:hypothetical protein [Usitatibacter sp.]
MPLALSFPAERTAPAKDLEVRPKQVKAWLQSLPMAQSADSGRKLCAHLAALNRAKLDLDERVQILDAYRPVAAIVLEELEAVYGKAPLPLAMRAREALLLARDLASELAIGYKIAIADTAARRAMFGARKGLPQLVLRAMEYLYALLRAGYKSYTPIPPGVWRDLHQLYLFAEEQKFASEVADPDTKEAVVTLYCECLLLALTDPYRLGPGDTDRVISQIRSSRAPVTLGQARPPTRTGGHFLVPCDTDKPPKPALSANDDTGGPNWRLLDANPLVDRLRLRQHAMETGNVSATTSKMVGPEGLALLAKLIVLWGDPPKRAYRRNPTTGTVAVCVGLKAVAHFVSYQPPPGARSQDEALRRGITMPMPALPMDDAAQPIPVFEYDVVNESEGGLKVRRLTATPQPIAVGEVVGIKAPGKVQWAIGVVRWITLYDEGGMEFGIQFLASAARVVSLQPTISGSGTPPRTALRFSHDDEDDALESLLTPVNTFSELREFELRAGDDSSCVRARALTEKTARFELFRVSPS